jgi:predicted nucleotidyltransferase
MDESVKSIPSLAELRARRDEILRIAAQYGASNVRVFGSVARGEASPDSDVDFLVTFTRRVSLFDRAGLWLDLQALLNCRVDVVDDQAVKPALRSAILSDAVVL